MKIYKYIFLISTNFFIHGVKKEIIKKENKPKKIKTIIIQDNSNRIKELVNNKLNEYLKKNNINITSTIEVNNYLNTINRQNILEDVYKKNLNNENIIDRYSQNFYHKEYQKQFNLKHKEEIKIKQKQYYSENKEEIKQYNLEHKEDRKQYNLEHKEYYKFFSRKQYKKIKKNPKLYKEKIECSNDCFKNIKNEADNIMNNFIQEINRKNIQENKIYSFFIKNFEKDNINTMKKWLLILANRNCTTKLFTISNLEKRTEIENEKKDIKLLKLQIKNNEKINKKQENYLEKKFINLYNIKSI